MRYTTPVDNSVDNLNDDLFELIPRQTFQYEQLCLDLDNPTFCSKDLALAAHLLRKKRKIPPPF